MVQILKLYLAALLSGHLYYALQCLTAREIIHIITKTFALPAKTSQNVCSEKALLSKIIKRLCVCLKLNLEPPLTVQLHGDLPKQFIPARTISFKHFSFR